MRKNLSREEGTKSVHNDLMIWYKLQDKSYGKGLHHVCFPVKFPNVFRQLLY